jgi:hypothetical protein
MGFADRLRAWFKGESSRRSPGPSSERPSRASTKDIEEFIASRAGVEAYLEPKTAIYSTTLLLVADDGEYLRRPVRDRGQATEVCKRCNVPLYDARKIGYPKRMKDYDRGVRPRRVDLDDLPPWPGDESTDREEPGPHGDPGGPPPPPVGDR